MIQGPLLKGILLKYFMSIGHSHQNNPNQNHWRCHQQNSLWNIWLSVPEDYQLAQNKTQLIWGRATMTWGGYVRAWESTQPGKILKSWMSACWQKHNLKDPGGIQ